MLFYRAALPLSRKTLTFVSGLLRKKRNHIHQLEALGYRVTLEPAA
jgi:hypothetical protein